MSYNIIIHLIFNLSWYFLRILHFLPLYSSCWFLPSWSKLSFTASLSTEPWPRNNCLSLFLAIRGRPVGDMRRSLRELTWQLLMAERWGLRAAGHSLSWLRDLWRLCWKPSKWQFLKENQTLSHSPVGIFFKVNRKYFSKTNRYQKN